MQNSDAKNYLTGVSNENQLQGFQNILKGLKLRYTFLLCKTHYIINIIIQCKQTDPLD